MKWSDLPEIDVLRAVEQAGRAEPRYLRDGVLAALWPGKVDAEIGHGEWAMIWHVETFFPGVPSKLLRAKLRRLMARGLVDGCDCGCRGDWHLTPNGWDAWLASGERSLPSPVVIAQTGPGSYAILGPAEA